jgi:methionyl aminopeptidase
VTSSTGHGEEKPAAVTPEILEIYRRAGRIAADARNWAAETIRPGMLVRELQEKIEERIFDSGAMPSFPAQTSRNNIAAHYCSSPTDETRYEAGDLVKIDIGAHIDGYPVDTGVSVDLSEDRRWSTLIAAASDALDAAIATVSDGVTVGKVGTAIDETIRKAGFQPIVNLSGHGLDRWQLHALPQIPNHSQPGGPKLKTGMIFAIEPFSTTGAGYVRDNGRAEIFRLEAKPRPSNKLYAPVMEALDAWNGLPVAYRYFSLLPRKPLERTFAELVRQGVMQPYSPLVEVSGAFVGWKEHTIYLGEDGPEVITA